MLAFRSFSKDQKRAKKISGCCSAEEREVDGQCVGNLIRCRMWRALAMYNLHCFQRRSGDIPTTNLMTGDRVVVSGEEKKFLALSTGYIKE
ncbi:hypothetical protein GDO81_004454 [Engystomops pustulosus]|uniref:DNA2 rift barrel domain-containing protein n=1 Tax=Engystomops pustulosus TaxID=76066 RepID=A0AAV6ZS86_ENGPU|nr:hypothetical protein GDO81_004454 [Engystomops pustulosus]